MTERLTDAERSRASSLGDSRWYVEKDVEHIVADRVAEAVERAEWWARTCTYWYDQAREAQRFRDMSALRAEQAEQALAEAVEQERAAMWAAEES